MSRFAGLGKQGNSGRVAVAARWLTLSLCLTASLTGCTRKFFRKQVDREVDHVLAEKDQYAPWKLETWHVYPDPRARFADPTNPDRPPMPPDDPAAWEQSPHPQRPGKAGIASVEGGGYLEALAAWNAENRAAKASADTQDQAATGFAARETQAVSADGPYLVKIDQAVELGLFNSREYQGVREDLYLAALPVTLQRFSFTAQFLATENAIRERTGRLTPEGQHNRWRGNTTFGVSKLFSTGALLVSRFANQTVVELTGRGPHTQSTSTLLLDLTQPFLRGGGRAVTLEPLTQTERNLVYEMRDFARFRKQFFVSIASGGGVAGGGGVGVFDPASGVSFQVSGGTSITGSGYLPILLRSAQTANERKNVAAFEAFLRLFNAFKEGGDIGQVNVDQVEQSLLGSRFTVIQRETDYRDALDRFKLQVGVPTRTLLDLDETPIQSMAQQLQRFERVFQDFEGARKEAEVFEQLENTIGLIVGARVFTAGSLATAVRGHLRRVATASALVRGTRFQKEVGPRWDAWEKLPDEQRTARLRKYLMERLRLLAERTELERAGKPIPEILQRNLELVESEIGLGRLEVLLDEYETQPWRKQPDASRRQFEHANLFRVLVSQFVQVLGDARAERLENVRQSWADLPRVCVNDVNVMLAELEDAQGVVAQAALINRLDLMNQRAQLVDSWRKIAVFANSLLGTLNIQYHLDSATPAGQAKPLAFTGSRSRHQLLINSELPLVRQLERNNYRSSLIAYQRSRRALMQAEDSVVATVRQQVRQLRLLAENYKIQQRLVELAYFQVEQSLETFRQPSTPSGLVAGPPGGGGGAGNAAALTQQLLGAQRSLNQAQNQLYTIWINFQIARMQLYRDLELMPLDFRGVWNDEHATCCDPNESGPDAGDRRNDRETGRPERLPEPRQHEPPAVRTKSEE